jgi:hypothetical protein
MASFSRRLGSASFTKPTVPEKQPSAERRRPYRLGRRDCPVRGGSPGEAPIDFSQEGHGASRGQRVGSEPHPGALACLGVGGHAPSLAMACLASAIDVTQEADPSHSARKPCRDNFRAGVFASSYTRLASDGELMNSLECHRDAVTPSTVSRSLFCSTTTSPVTRLLDTAHTIPARRLCCRAMTQITELSTSTLVIRRDESLLIHSGVSP